MKRAKDKLVAALMASPGLAAFVDDRIYYQHPPEKPTYPLLTYSQVGGTTDYADHRAYFDRPRFEIKIWGEHAEEIAEEVRAAMDGIGARLISDVDLWDHESLQPVKALDFRMLLKR